MSNPVADHYESQWGRASRTRTFYAANQKTRVYEWDASRTDEGVTLYATVGASDGANLGSHRVEFIAGLLPADDAFAMSLAGIAAFPRVRGEVNKGDTVSLEQPLWPGAQMRAFLVIPSVNAYIPTIPVGDYHVEFLRVLPIHPAEIELKKVHGASWLMRQLHRQGLVMSDPQRPPVVDPDA
jgi:hypothetical protein